MQYEVGKRYMVGGWDKPGECVYVGTEGQCVLRSEYGALAIAYANGSTINSAVKVLREYREPVKMAVWVALIRTQSGLVTFMYSSEGNDALRSLCKTCSYTILDIQSVNLCERDNP
jgi:hypothetical protein